MIILAISTSCLLICIVFCVYIINKIKKKNNKIADKMHTALQVIIITHKNREWLEKNDPRALRQAENVCKRYMNEYDKS